MKNWRETTDYTASDIQNQRKNVRVIYVIEEGAIILLTAFLEKNRGDYKRAVDTALERLKWLAR